LLLLCADPVYTISSYFCSTTVIHFTLIESKGFGGEMSIIKIADPPHPPTHRIDDQLKLLPFSGSQLLLATTKICDTCHRRCALHFFMLTTVIWQWSFHHKMTLIRHMKCGMVLV